MVGVPPETEPTTWIWAEKARDYNGVQVLAQIEGQRPIFILGAILDGEFRYYPSNAKKVKLKCCNGQCANDADIGTSEA